MEWLVISAGAILGLLVLRSFVLACFPASDLARSVEFDISLSGSTGGFGISSCREDDSGGGDGGGGD